MSIENYNAYDYHSMERGYANPVILKDAASKMLDVIVDHIPEGPVTLVATGGSGSAIATAILLEAHSRNLSDRITMVISVRNFGSSLEDRNRRDRLGQIVFVDDHISTGSTFDKVFSWLPKPEKISLCVTITSNEKRCGDDVKVVALKGRK